MNLAGKANRSRATHIAVDREEGTPLRLVRHDPLDEILVRVIEIHRSGVHPRLPNRPVERGAGGLEAIYPLFPISLIHSDREVNGAEALSRRKSGELFEQEVPFVQGDSSSAGGFTGGEPGPLVVWLACVRIQ